MTTDAKIAILNGSQPAVAAAIASLPADQQDAILTNGGSVTLASGKSPNGMQCALIAKVASNLTADVFAVSADGREQSVAVGNVAKIVAMLAK
jgi:hypothetical protein